MATGTFCGTGSWATAPKPGDPEGDVNLWATPAFGGIDVEWSYPGVNPQAVAFVRLYRSTNLTDPDPVLYRILTGTFFYDKTDTATAIEYAYWIELVSINGTVGDRIGPATATARPPIAAVMEALSGQIDESLLGQTLKAEIDRIQLNKLGVDDELLAQAAVSDSLAAAFTELQAYSDDTRALVQEETVARTSANDAFVAQVNSLAVALGDDITAAIQTEAQARVSGDQAVANQITTAEARLGEDLAQVQTGLQTNINTVNGKVTEIGALYTAKVDVNGLIGGFGVYNNGTLVDAGFDVDRFWVGRTNTNKVKPFIISGDETFINEAVINKLTFNKLRSTDGSFVVSNGKIRGAYIEADQLNVKSAATFTGTAQSSDFRANQRGWRIQPSGAAEFNNVKVRGILDGSRVTGSTIEGSVIIGTAFVARTELDPGDNRHLGLTSTLSWSDTQTLGETTRWSNYVDIRSANYNNKSHYRRFRRRRIPLKCDVTFGKIVATYRKTYIRVRIYSEGTLFADTGTHNIRYNSSTRTGNSRGPWSLGIKRGSTESCSTDCTGNTYCGSDPHYYGFVFTSDSFDYTGDGRLRFVVTISSDGDTGTSKMVSTAYAYNDY